MAKQLNVNLAFNADTSQAKAQIQSLSKSLQDIAKMPGNASSLFDDTQIKKASQAALELQQHLSKAVNTDTGKLDLSRFSSSLKASNRDLSTYCDTLLSTGEEGQQAFLKLAQAIASADTPVTRVNKKLAEMGVVIKNTARWQISSSILHGFMGAVQSAYGYAQDLNDSLNDIRIVTGQNIDQMKDFAVEANRAAKALSATTTEYTNASLIYYQQGLSKEQVLERADITVKMANVANQSAEVVSDQMTAVWNNFYDGSKSLEYYADVMTALGAATASSTDEIAGGLEKFAAIGETIGLSYEYAASALATITSNTRQSEEVVGTALKTIFARIQGLNLGETLDDGTTLNKYSTALQKVGISIFDQTGELKKMDTILDEMGSKWGDLNKAQQVALAQTVAGVRQYNQLVSLMDNWNKGDSDSFQANLNTARNSEGALQQQADIYAESWEAAQDRVTAAAENIYDSLINDEFFIDLLNGFEKVLETIGGLVDGLGGLKGVVGVVGSVFLTHFAKQMPETLENLRQNFMVLTGQAKKEMVKVQDTMSAKLAVQMSAPGASESFKLQAEGIASVSKMKQKLILESKNLTTQERADYEARIKNVEAMYDEAAALAKLADEQEQTATASANSLAENAAKDAQGLINKHTQASKNKKTAENYALAAADNNDYVDWKKYNEEMNKAAQAQEDFNQKIDKMAEAYAKLDVKDIVDASGNIDPSKQEAMAQAVKKVTDEYKQQITQYTKLDVLQSDLTSQTSKWKKYASEIDKSEKAVKELKVSMTGYKTAIKGIAEQSGMTFPTKAAEKFDAVLQKPGVTAKECAEAFEKFSDSIGAELKSRLDTLTQDLEETDATLDDLELSAEGLKNMRTSAEKAAEGTTKLALSTGNIKGQVDAGIESTFKASVAFTEFGSAVMSVSATIDSIKNAISVFGDEGASGFEMVGAAISIVMAALSAYNSLQQLTNTLSKAGFVTKMLEAKGYALTTTASGALTIAKTGETGAVVANTAAWYANPIMWIALIVVGVIAALTVLIATIIKVSEALKNMSAAEQLKQAEAEAARLTQALNDAKDAAESLRSSIENYDGAVDKLKTLTEGTEEWRDALNEANDAARKLIEDNPELAGKYSFNADTGLIEFEKGALEGLQSQADQRVTAATSQSIAAQNNVLDKKNNVLLSDATKGDNAAVAITAGITSGFAAAVPLIGPALATSIQANAAMHDVSQQKALSNLAEKFDLADGNLSEALNQMSESEMTLINSLNLNDTELQKLCSQLAANNDAIRENNKQLAHTNFSGNSAYENSANKDFLAEVLGADIDAKTEQLYASKYQDGAGMTDKQAQKKYAEMMGYEWKKNKGGNQGVYVDSSGQEVTIDDAVVRKYLAQQEAINAVGGSIEETSGKISELALIETRLSKTADGSIKSYERYKQTMMAYGKELGFTEDQIDSFIQKQGHMQKEAKTATLANNIAGWGHDEEASKQAAEALAQGLTDEQMQIALQVSADSSSYDEFMRGFEQALNQSILSSFQNSSAGVEELMATMAEGNNLTADQIDTLEQDENFQAYLEETGQTMLDFTSANYSERYRIISSFYADLKASEYEALENSKQNYEADLAEYQAIIDYKRSLDANGNETDASKAIKDQFDNIDFSAYVDMDISDVESEMDKIQDAIDEIDGQKIKLDLEWESTDAIENSMKKIGNFANVMQNDAKKVGNSYQLTAAQAKEWMQVYPELFANADVTTDGLISLNEDYVNEFIGGQEASTDAAIDANIQQLESRISELEAEKEAYEADLELAESNAVGKEQLANASTEFLAEQRERLVNYYIDSGLDEVAANKAALNTMGLNEEEYSELVANSYSRNAANQIKSAEQGASGQSSVLGKLWNKVRDWASKVGNLFKNVWGALTGKVQWSDVWGAWSGGSVTSDVQVSGLSAYDHNGNFRDGFEAERNAALDEVNSSYADSLRASIADIDNRIASIRAEIAYNEALRNQTLDEYGSTDPDDVDGTNDQEDGKDKETKDDFEEMLEDAERYHELTREVEAYERALEKLGKQKERAFGKNKIALMDKELETMEALYNKEKELLNAQQIFLASDLLTVEDAFASDVELDANGNISNYSELTAEAQGALNTAKQAYNDAINAYNASEQNDTDKAALEAAEKALEEAEKVYEQRMGYLEQYEETLDATHDQIDKMEEQLYAMQDLQFEKFNYIMEVDMAAAEEELKMIDHYLSKIEDDFYSAEEAARLLVGTLEELSRGQFGGKMQQYMDNLAYAEQKQAELEELYKNKQISEEQYQEGLSGIRDMYYENMDALQELDKQMMEYYSNTLAQAQEELSKYTSQMEHQTAVLEHFQSLITLMGKQNDYKMIGKVLEGQVETTKNSAEVSRQWYEARRAAADDLAAEYADAVERGASPEELEMIKQKWQDAEVAANEAQEQMLSDAEAWAEALKAVLENKLADLGQTLENALTGEFGSFDQMTTAMERANSLQEEYLTTTNQIYETNKLMRTAQQEIDKSTNSVAKRKLQAYIEETKELQNQTKLSQYELDIQQAKYDLLLAEIALEEAQQSKSTVRLQRDSEGNFGYVYTADSNQMAEAQQNLEDAQNKLYNIGLDGANDYAQKYQQTMSEMYDTMAQLQQDYLNGAFESEAEYNTAMEAAKQYYYQKLQDYSQLYSVALTTDSRVVSDAWSTDFSSMIYDTEKWMSEVNKYVDGTARAFIDWQTAVSGPGGVTSIIGGSLEEVGGNVDSVTQKSEDLAKVTKEQVIPGLEAELTAVDNLTGAYARMRDTISQAIEKYEQLINGINDSQTQDWESEDDSGSGSGNNTGSNSEGGENTDSDNGDNTDSNSDNGNNTGSDNGTNPAATDLTAGQEVTVKTTATKFVTGETMWDAVKGNKFKVMSVNGDTVLIGDPCGPNYSDTGITGYVKKSDLEGFDTGGYTGNWGGSYGKLALLHKKELILKEGDTANFLEGMSILDKIVSAIDLYSMNSQLGGILSSPSLGRVNDNMLEQQVHIEASFPAVQDRNEIEEAFNNLINRASQYANRK